MPINTGVMQKCIYYTQPRNMLIYSMLYCFVYLHKTIKNLGIFAYCNNFSYLEFSK